MPKYRIQKRKLKVGVRWVILRNGKTILGGYKTQEKAKQAMVRRRAQDRYARKVR